MSTAQGTAKSASLSPDRRASSTPPDYGTARETELPKVIDELVRATHARAAVLTLHTPGRQPPALLFADASLRPPQVEVVRTLCCAVRPTFDSGRPFWRFGPTGSGLALMLVPIEPVPDHGQVLLGLLFDAPDEAVRQRAEQLIRKNTILAFSYFRLWQLNRLRAQRETGLRAALHEAARGIALVDRLHRVVLANRVLDTLVAQADGLCRISGRLHATHAAADARLQQTLLDLLEPAAGLSAERQFLTLPRTLGTPLFAIARCCGAPSADPDQRLVMLDVLDPRRHDAESFAAACRSRGFSRGETWLTSHLAHGGTLAEMAPLAGVQDRSVRHYLRQALRKAGATSAEELVIAILSQLAGIAEGAGPRPVAKPSLSRRAA